MTQCAWCVSERLAEHDNDASHGICDAHVLKTFVMPRVQGVIARLSGESYAGASMREVLAADLMGVERVLEQMVERMLRAETV